MYIGQCFVLIGFCSGRIFFNVHVAPLVLEKALPEVYTLHLEQKVERFVIVLRSFRISHFLL